MQFRKISEKLMLLNSKQVVGLLETNNPRFTSLNNVVNGYGNGQTLPTFPK